MTILGIALTVAAWAALAFFAAAAFAGDRDPERQKEEDDYQWRWLLEQGFIRRLDAAGNRRGYEKAWQLALAAAKQTTRNITTWSEHELQEACRALKKNQENQECGS